MVRVGPVPGLGVGEEVDGGVGQGEGVAAASDDRDVGERAAELGCHAGAGLYGDHVGAAGVEEGGGYAGAGADVCDAGAGEGGGQVFYGVAAFLCVPLFFCWVACSAG